MNPNRMIRRFFVSFALSVILLVGGGGANLAVVMANGGLMPVEHLRFCEENPDYGILDGRHQCANPQTSLRFLDDRFVGRGMIFSVGDAALVTGQILTITVAAQAACFAYITRRKRTGITPDIRK